jgi:hypothetical protein
MSKKLPSNAIADWSQEAIHFVGREFGVVGWKTELLKRERIAL